MGYFDVHCAESGLVLDDEAVALLIAERDGVWVPCALPMFGTYDRLGAIEELTTPAPIEHIFDHAEYSGVDDNLAYEDLLHELFQGRAKWNGLVLSYTLIDARIYRAIAATMASSVAPLEYPKLVARTLPLPQSQHLYRDAESDASTADAMLELARFLAWGTKLVPADQLPNALWYEGDEEMVPFLEAARARYRGKPLILRAVEASASRWELPSDDPSAAAIVRVSELSFARAFSGDRVLEVDREDVDRVVAALEGALAQSGRDVVVQGPVWRLRFRRSEVASWSSEDDDDDYAIAATPQLVRELTAILRAPQASVAHELESLPGVAVRW